MHWKFRTCKSAAIASFLANSFKQYIESLELLVPDLAYCAGLSFKQYIESLELLAFSGNKQYPIVLNNILKV